MSMNMNRRDFLTRSGGGFGMIALAALLAEDGHLTADDTTRSADPLAPRPPHHAARARNVIFLFMSGGPSHLETFDPKPELRRLVLAIRSATGIEALVWLTDIAGLSREEAGDVMRWSASALLRSALSGSA